MLLRGNWLGLVNKFKGNRWQNGGFLLEFSVLATGCRQKGEGWRNLKFSVFSFKLGKEEIRIPQTDMRQFMLHRWIVS